MNSRIILTVPDEVPGRESGVEGLDSGVFTGLQRIGSTLSNTRPTSTS